MIVLQEGLHIVCGLLNEIGFSKFKVFKNMKYHHITHLKNTKGIILLICVASSLACLWSLQIRYCLNLKAPSSDVAHDLDVIPDLLYLTDLDLNHYDRLEISKFTGVPFKYPARVDFRIIVLTFSRSKSLQILLDYINNITLDGHSGAVEIWIDIDAENRIHRDVLMTAMNYSSKIGQTAVHIQPKHVGIYGQWIHTWQPQINEWDVRQEIALILEDDMIVSPLVYRWMRAVHDKYGGRSDFAGASLNGGSQMTAHNNGKKIVVDDPAFMYICIGTWGFSPSPRVWIGFQEWYARKSKDSTFHPYVYGALPDSWYRKFELIGKEDTMWEMWFIFYANENRLLTVYSNVVDQARLECNWNFPFSFICWLPFHEEVFNRLCFGFNRQEVGLHQDENSLKFEKCPLVEEWSDSYINLPDEPQKFDWWGSKFGVS